MSKCTRWILVLCAVSVFLAGVPVTRGADATTWEALRERLMACGADKKQCTQLRVTMQKRGLGAPEAERILQPTFLAANAALPVDVMLDRVMEGTAKGVSPEQITLASDRRRQRLLQAMHLMDQHKVRYTNRARARLLEGAALAMESGLSPEALGPVMQMWRHKTASQLTAAIEAGEILRLNGLGDKLVTELMCDYLERDLRRTEMRRAIRSVVTIHRRGVQDDQVSRALWGKGAGEHYGRIDRADTAGPAVSGRDRESGMAVPAHGTPPVDGSPGPDGYGPGPAVSPGPGESSQPGSDPGGAPGSDRPGAGPGPEGSGAGPGGSDAGPAR